MLSNKIILLTGGTGTFGSHFVAMTLQRYNPEKLIILPRDGRKRWEMASRYVEDPRLHFFIGDVRDRERLNQALNGVECEIHAAAAKVTMAKHTPFDPVGTNVIGVMNLIDACIDRGVERVVVLSPDKPSNPINRDVASTLATDKLFETGNSCAGGKSTRFAVIRCGNLRGARGSVIPFFQSIRDRGVRPITESRMTRFMFTPEQAGELVWAAFADMEGGRIRVRRTPSLTVTDIARSVAPDTRPNVVGNRPGEQRQAQMIGPEDFTPARHSDSDSDSRWMRPEDPRDKVERNAARIGAI